MEKTKAWDWAAAKQKVWLEPSEESYYLAHRWNRGGAPFSTSDAGSAGIPSFLHGTVLTLPPRIFRRTA